MAISTQPAEPWDRREDVTLPYRPRVLFVDDDVNLRRALARALVQTFDITQAADGTEAIELLETGSYDAVVTDLSMPKLGGDGLVRWLEENQPAVARRVVVLTGGSSDPAQAAWLQGFDQERVLSKPCDVGELVRAIGAAVDEGQSS